MINHCRTLKDSKDSSIYNNFYLNDYRNFQIEENNKYNLVIANLSLHYSLNLAENLSTVAKLITNKGFILLALYTSDAPTSFDYELQNFCYSEEFIKTCAAENNLNFIEIGKTIKKGDTLLIIEAMKTMNQIPSTLDGKVIDILVSNESPVEFGTPLVIIE